MRPNPEVASKGSAGGALTTAPYLGERTHHVNETRPDNR